MKEMKVLTRQQVANHLQKYRRKMRLVVKRSEEDASIASSYSPMSSENDQSERDSPLNSSGLVPFSQDQFHNNQNIPNPNPTITVDNEEENKSGHSTITMSDIQPKNKTRSNTLVPESAFQPLQLNSSPFRASTLPLQPLSNPMSPANFPAMNILDWFNPAMNHFAMSQLSQNLVHPQAIAQIQSLMFPNNPYIRNILGPAMNMRQQKKDDQ